MKFPLGLGSRLHKFPIMIAVLSALLLASSWQYLGKINSAKSAIRAYRLDSQIDEQLGLHKMNLLVQYCHNEFAVTTEDCRWPGDAGKKNGKFTAANSDSANLRRRLAADHDVFDGRLHSPWESTKLLLGLSFLQRDLDQELDTYPESLRQLADYQELKTIKLKADAFAKASFSQQALPTSEVRDPLQILLASFLTENWYHLACELWVLLLIGVWVEQSLGSLATGGIFLAGSFVSSAALLCTGFITGAESLLLVSAGGVMALAGVYYGLFFKAHIWIGRICLKVSWVLPILLIVNEVISKSTDFSKAYKANLIALFFGIVTGVAVRAWTHFAKDQFFHQEKFLMKKLLHARKPEDFTHGFCKLMNLNPQNWFAIRLMLRKVGRKEIAAKPEVLDSVGRYLQHHFFTEDVSEIIHALNEFPANLKLQDYLQKTPLSQVLFLGDACADRQNFYVAERLYELALSRVQNDSDERDFIFKALEASRQLRGPV